MSQSLTAEGRGRIGRRRPDSMAVRVIAGRGRSWDGSGVQAHGYASSEGLLGYPARHGGVLMSIFERCGHSGGRSGRSAPFGRPGLSIDLDRDGNASRYVPCWQQRRSMGPRVFTIIPVYRGSGEFTYLLVESDEEGTVDQSLTLTFD